MKPKAPLTHTDEEVSSALLIVALDAHDKGYANGYAAGKAIAVRLFEHFAAEHDWEEPDFQESCRDCAFLHEISMELEVPRG